MKDSFENEELVLDTSGTECPIPVLKARKLASELNKDTIIKIIATVSFGLKQTLNIIVNSLTINI